MPVTAHRAKLAGCVLEDGVLSSSLYVDTETQRIVRRSANGQRRAYLFDMVHSDIHHLYDRTLGRAVARQCCEPSEGDVGSSLLLHGPNMHSNAAILVLMVERLLRQVRRLLSGSDEIKVSLLRVYSWGATDLLRKEVVEQCTTPPNRTPLRESPQESISRHPMSLREAFEADLQGLRRLLKDAVTVPVGCGVVRFEVWGWCRSYPTSLQWNVCLLPPLQRVNRKFMMDLVRLREAFDSSTGRDPCRNRLKELLLNLHVPVTVVTLLDPAAGPEAIELHGWYGSVPLPDEMIPPCSPTTSTHTSTLATHPPFYPTPSGQNRLTGKCVDAVLQLDGAPSSIRTPSPFSISPQGNTEGSAGTCFGAGAVVSVPREKEEVRQEMDCLRQETVQLSVEKASLRRDIHHLQLYKVALETEVGGILRCLGDAMETALSDECAMAADVEHSIAVLQTVESVTLCRERQVFERLSTVLAMGAYGHHEGRLHHSRRLSETSSPISNSIREAGSKTTKANR